MEYVNGFSYSYSGILCVLLAFGIVTLAQIILRITYARYKRKQTETELTGKEVAEAILKANEIEGIKIMEVSGSLTDYYDDRNKTIALSKDIYEGRSIASAAVAAHECGHAIQYKTGYKPIAFRNKMVPIVNLSNSIGYSIMIVGFAANTLGLFYLAANTLGLFYLGIILFSSALIFQLITLPCEFDASKRANKELLRLKLINEHEHRGTKTMLKAAAFTYVAGLFSSILEILRLILIFTSNRRRD